ncbi:hypothetical protein HTIA_2457 [Halorhabdus tiamatea SARL4B]|uniref:Uncharacterized protein n=1 Tax=Halorhabdus tiamatea SARL4B TaxID=1033806 RepID=S6D3U7_9EURY|nr:hypothetical protein HTIA_2457 [Halorhabdus tiamatea SARL4B]
MALVVSSFSLVPPPCGVFRSALPDSRWRHSFSLGGNGPVDYAGRRPTSG